MNSRFPKNEKLKSRKAVGQLFVEGKSVSAFPLKLFYCLPAEGEGVKMAVSVSKRNFKTAVKRNRIKRLLREAYRLNKHLLTPAQSGSQPALNGMVIFLGKEMPNYALVEKKMKQLLEKLRDSSGTRAVS